MKKILSLIVLLFALFAVTACNINIGGSIIIDTGVTVSGSSKVIVGEEIQLKATVHPSTANQEVTWDVSNETVASISDSGLLTGLKAGRVTVSATSVANNQNIGYTYINVIAQAVVETNEAPDSITISGYNDVKVGELARYSIYTVPNNASHKVDWTSDNESVLTIDESGNAFPIASGVATITATSKINNSITATKIVTVTENMRSSDLEEAVQNVFTEVKDSVLGVSHYKYDKTSKRLVIESLGSGFIYKAWAIMKDNSIIDDIDSIVNKDDIKTYGYYFLTNKHVVEGSDAIKIYLHQSDKEIDATLIQYDSKIDIAVVTFEYDEYLKPLRFANTDNLTTGTFAVAIGNPESFDFSSSLTFGIISAPKRYLGTDTDNDGIDDWDAEYIQHDVAINPGNSGGPLLDLYGQVLGVNTLKFAATDIDNMGFSIPMNEIADILDYLEKGETPTRAVIGVTVGEVRSILQSDPSQLDYNYNIPSDVENGLYVSEVKKDSVAERGGVQVDDIMIEFNGVSLIKSLQLRAELNKIIVGSNTKINVKVIRNGKTLDLVLEF